MTEIEVFLIIITSHLIAVMSPGPDMAIIIRHSLAYAKPCAIWTALGIGTGILVHVFYSIIGLGLVIATNPTIFAFFKFLGVGYLLYLAYLGLRSGRMALRQDRATKRLNQGLHARLTQTARVTRPKRAHQILPAVQSYRIGLLTNALNVKATIFFLSVYLLVAHNSPLSLQIGYGIYMAVATGIFFILVAELLAKLRPFLQLYLAWLEIGTAVLLALLAMGLAAFSTQDLLPNNV